MSTNDNIGFNNNSQMDRRNDQLDPNPGSTKENGESQQDHPKLTSERLSIKDLWAEFCDDTSMHGVKKTRLRRKWQLRGIIWSLAVLAMIIFLLLTLFHLHSSYTRYPVITKVNIEHGDRLSFPAVTICNLSPLNKSKVDMTQERINVMLKLSTVGHRFQDIDINWNSTEYRNFSLPGQTAELNASGFSLPEFIGHCRFDSIQFDCHQHLKPRLTRLGRCFTFNSDGFWNTSKTGSSNGLVTYVSIGHDHYYLSPYYLSAGIKVVVHSPDEEPDVDNEGFVASPGFAVYAAIKLIKNKYLPSPYKAFKTHYCLDTEATEFRNNLKYYSTYSYNACMQECRLDLILKACKCRLEMDPGNATICSFMDLQCYYSETRLMEEGMDIPDSHCGCEYPCKTEKYEHVISTAYYPNEEITRYLQQIGLTDSNVRKDVLELRVHFDSLQYKENEQIPEYTMSSMAGTLGGLLGLFLGASVLTLSEFLEFVLLAAWLLLKRLLDRQKISP